MNFLEIDPNILLGIINMKLRDKYDSLEALCDDLDIDIEKLTKKLDDGGYIYQRKNNQFIQK